MTVVTSDKLKSFLRNRKFVELGSGLYSDVFASVGSDRVIKICNNTDDWPNYIIWATQNGYAGLFAPKVYSFKKLGEREYIAVMERLQPIRERNGYKLDADGRKARDEWHATINSKNHNPQLHEFIKKIEKVFEYTDLHDGNVMHRNGSLVITDPVTHGNHKETIPNRMRAYDIAMTRNAQFTSQKAMRKQA